ncbi:MAG: flippase-like domain-containing protein [Ruminococcus sp.]|nr:flippase-like domain-containing protein [Ruminococcus sp.]
MGFIGVIIWLTFRLLFKGQELGEILEDLGKADLLWVTLAGIATFVFIAGESCIIHYMLRVFGQKTNFLSCLKYSFIGFFFSYITPSSSGGQPAQMYYMKKDGVKIGLSTLIMLLITIAYKSVLVALGAVFLIFNFHTVAEYAGDLDWLLVLGFVLNIAFISMLVAVFFKPNWARKAGIRIVNLLSGWKIVKGDNNEKLITKITRICDNYTMGSTYIRENVVTVVKIFAITLVQRMSLFSVTWLIYKAYGLSGVSFLDIITMQIMIGIAVEMLPLPGAAGITEVAFTTVFGRIFSSQLVKPAMLISRGLTFYCVLIVGGIVTLWAHIRVIRSDRTMEEKNKEGIKE